MTKEFKFYIFGEENTPLCLTNKALEFDAYNQAEEFMKRLGSQDSYFNQCRIEKRLLFYHGGCLNVSNCLPYIYSDDGDVMLVNKFTNKIEFI